LVVPAEKERGDRPATEPTRGHSRSVPPSEAARPHPQPLPAAPPASTVVKAPEPRPPISAPSSDKVLTAPVRPIEEMKRPPVSVALILRFRELDQEKRCRELLEELRKATTHRLDVGSPDPAAVLERLQAGLGAEGIRLVFDPAAQSCLKLRLKTNY